MAGQGLTYAVDLVICIDATGSMGPVIKEVKESASGFYQKISEEMESLGKKVDQLRTKIIVFRDYYFDPADAAMVESPFFDMKTQEAEYAAFVSGILVDGGGDEPENGLEALALAVLSDWEKGATFSKRRQVIMMFTDASAHSLEKSGKPEHYPGHIPGSLDELTELWAQMSASSKRLVLFAPDASPWPMLEAWDQLIFFPSKAGKGLEEFEMGEIVDIIANSV